MNELLFPETCCMPGPGVILACGCACQCVCLCVLLSVLVYEHMKLCLQGLDKSSSTTLTLGLKD